MASSLLKRIPAAPYVVELIRRRPALAVRFTLASIARGGLTTLVIYLMQQFLAGVLGGKGGLSARLAELWGADAALYAVAGALAACYLLSSVVSYEGQVVEQRLIRDIELGLMERMTRHLLTLSVDFFDKASHGDLTLTLRQDVARVRSVVAAQARMVFELAQAIGLIAAAVWLSPMLAFAALIALPAASAPMLWMARRTLKRSFDVRRSATGMYDVLLQTLRGIRVIKIYRGEAVEAERASLAAQEYFSASIEMAKMEALGKVLVEAVAGLSIVLVVIVGGFQVLHGTLSWPSLLAFLLAIRSVHGPLNNINSQYLEASRYGASLQRIDELMSLGPSVKEPEKPEPLSNTITSIRFESVGFAYGEEQALEDVSFEARTGNLIGVVGPSGAGKSTLLSLIARFFDPTSGRVLVNGQDLRGVAASEVYRHVAMVPQTPFLFSCSVMENIRIGRTDATDEEVARAARAAEIHDEVATWPEGYGTLIGPGGRAVSEGQAQRINIARALLKDAPILLLDEASSALDALTEAKVKRAIQSLIRGRITFVIAHRLSTIRNASHILVLEKGCCVADGTHESLLQDSSLYAELWATHSGAPNVEQAA